MKFFFECVLRVLGSLLIALTVIALVFGTIWAIAFWESGQIYETNSLSDYGKIKGNYDNDTPKEFIFSFFPETIDPTFSDVAYHYKAIKGDSYAYEAYLEFTVTDVTQYQQLVAAYTKGKECPLFAYDKEYYLYTISNLFSSDEEQLPAYIDRAEIGLVLFSDTKQQLIFVAIGMYDGGGANTDELGYFFKKFDVDILASYVPYDIKTRTRSHLVLTEPLPNAA